MASGKVMTKSGLVRSATKAELETKLREANAQLSKIGARVAEINKRLDKDPVAPWWYWYPYAAAVGLAAGAAISLYGRDSAFIEALF